MNAIEVRQLSKVIRGREILKDIHLSLEKGKIYGFFGPNGSGKTMLFRALCGLIKPTTGSITLNGKQLHKDISFPESVGVIIESPGFWPQYTGWENLKLLARIKNIISDADIKHAIQRVGLSPEDDRTLKRYSLGMKQRLAIAQAIMEKPDFLFLDEPTNALDEDAVHLVRNILLEEKSRGATILLASHNKDDLDILADLRFKVRGGELSSDHG
ncbi:ABC transporter ATP-binding protein [Brevibacillus sp. SAFN-007a]|uniref:ABC transporter ATP-binding protein n=1 Tax=Brevibacillus sp. SAFN-007a TaxID=3436862 RepID=UPI003F808D1D